MAPRHFNSFADFWPFYVTEHRRPMTRWLHAIGTITGLVLLLGLIVLGKWWLFPLAFVPGYGLAWIGHFFVERNKPATFAHPLWSFMGDWKMLALMITGRMAEEAKRSEQ